MTGLLRGCIWNETVRPEFGIGPLAGDSQQISLRQDFQGTFHRSKDHLSNKGNSFLFAFTSLFGDCRKFWRVMLFRLTSSLQPFWVLPWITDMSSQETLGPHKPEYFSSSPTELKTAMILAYIHVALPDTPYRISMELSVEP